MSNTARKARKTAGIKFSKPAKIGTPPEERAYVLNPVMGAPKTRHDGSFQNRSPKKVQKFLEARGIKADTTD
jgi:hypothetical protein